VAASLTPSAENDNATSGANDNAKSNQFAGPGALQEQHWTTWDFVKHYFFGGGSTVDLANVGLSDEFRNSSSVRGLTNGFIGDTLERAYPGYMSSATGGSDVTYEPNLFSVGHSTLYMSSGCGVTTCAFNFQIRDSFRDPLDIGVGIPGGTSYKINDNWTVLRPYSGGRQ
jgi:hypothetical protein